jgi:hypothetical protein
MRTGWDSSHRGGYFEIDLTTWTGRIYRADGAVAKVLFGGPGQQVQLNIATAPVAQPTTSQPVQLTLETAPLAPLWALRQTPVRFMHRITTRHRLLALLPSLAHESVTEISRVAAFPRRRRVLRVQNFTPP